MRDCVGSEIYKTIHAFWKLAAVVRGIDIEVWKNNSVEPHITKIWLDEGLMEQAGTTGKTKPTELGWGFIKCGDLLKYEATMLEPQLFGKTKVTDKSNYSLLRKGLKNYCELELWPHLEEMANTLPKDAVMLDYCGGSGSYLESFLRSLPDSRGYLVDKSPDVRPPLAELVGLCGVNTIDFKKDKDWYKIGSEYVKTTKLDYMGKFDFIMLNEILHCCNESDMIYLLSSSLEMLKTTGNVLVTEQKSNPVLDWRLHDYTKDGKTLPIESVARLALCNGFSCSTMHSTNTHWFLLLNKRKGE